MEIAEDSDLLIAVLSTFYRTRLFNLLGNIITEYNYWSHTAGGAYQLWTYFSLRHFPDNYAEKPMDYVWVELSRILTSSKPFSLNLKRNNLRICEKKWIKYDYLQALIEAVEGPMDMLKRKRKWQWIGHRLRKDLQRNIHIITGKPKSWFPWSCIAQNGGERERPSKKFLGRAEEYYQTPTQMALRNSLASVFHIKSQPDEAKKQIFRKFVMNSKMGTIIITYHIDFCYPQGQNYNNHP